MLMAVKVFILFFFGVPIAAGILYLMFAAECMQREEKRGKEQVRARRARQDARRARADAGASKESA